MASEVASMAAPSLTLKSSVAAGAILEVCGRGKAKKDWKGVLATE